MRLLIELESSKDCVYDLKYHHKLQGFIYSLLRGTPYEELHGKRGYKFFCFSNIFPPKDMQRGERRSLLISSPDESMINVFEERIREFQKIGGRVNVGEMSFEVKRVRPLRSNLSNSCTLITGTPIVVRIPKEKYGFYGIQPSKDYPYVYWRKRYPFDAFIKQLEDNIIKKYNMFYGISIDPHPIFEQFAFQKPVCNHMVIGGREVKVLGSLWKFTFNHLDREHQRLIQFGSDTGFGELNSLGFGFINMVK